MHCSMTKRALLSTAVNRGSTSPGLETCGMLGPQSGMEEWRGVAVADIGRTQIEGAA